MYWLSYCLTTGTWLCPQVVPVQRWRKRDLCQWPWHCSREGDGNYEVITLITGFDPLSFYRQLLSQRNSSNIKIYQFQRFKEQRDTLYICKAKNISIVNKSFFILPPPMLSLFLFLCHTQEFIGCYHVGDSQYFQCYEPFPKLGQKGLGRLIHRTENEAPKHNHVREHNTCTAALY